MDKKLGRPFLYKEVTKVVSFKVPISKIKEFKFLVKIILSGYTKKLKL